MSECYSKHYSKVELFIFKYLTFATFYMSSFLFKPKKIFIFIKDIFTMQGTTRLSMSLINFIRRYKAKKEIDV